MLHTSVYRIWARARLGAVRKWESGVANQGFWWGGKGTAVERPAWNQGLYGELGTAVGSRL